MTSFMAGIYGFGGEAVYCMTKFAQVGFAQALDKELRPNGIKVGVICPGGVKTEFALGKGRTEAGVASPTCWIRKMLRRQSSSPARSPTNRASSRFKCARWPNRLPEARTVAETLSPVFH